MLRRPSLPHTPGPQSPVSPPHNPHPCASPLKPHKSPPPPLLHRTQAHGRFYLRHMQVRRHHYPVTARKIRLRRRLVTCKPRRDAIPTRHARPTTMPTRHCYDSDTIHFPFSYLTHYAYVPKPHDST